MSGGIGMVKKLKPLWTQLLSAVVILSLFLVYIFYAGRSGSWFYDKYSTAANYQIGRINFLIYGKEEYSEIPLKLLANAPTRYYELDDVSNGVGDFDVNFNKTATVKLVYGVNLGDVDVNVNLSYQHEVPDAPAATGVFYYLFVPISEDENFTGNFLTGNYSKYLDTVFASADMSTPAKRQSAFAEQNAANIDKLQGIKVTRGAHADLCYLLFWPEYDFADWGNPDAYYEFNETMTIIAHSFQYYTLP